MPCHRCHRLMTVDSYIDMGSSRNPLWLRAWRCVNCGEVAEPGVFTNRAAHRNWLRRMVKRLNGTRLRRDDLMPLTA
jgi:secreted trypsin-like serine protease